MSRAPVNDQAYYDDAFRHLIGCLELTAVTAAVSDREHLRRAVRRIAGGLFCAVGIDPSVVSFARSRVAQQWGRDENEIDVMIAARLLRTATALSTELHGPGGPAATAQDR